MLGGFLNYHCIFCATSPRLRVYRVSFCHCFNQQGAQKIKTLYLILYSKMFYLPLYSWKPCLYVPFKQSREKMSYVLCTFRNCSTSNMKHRCTTIGFLTIYICKILNTLCTLRYFLTSNMKHRCTTVGFLNIYIYKTLNTLCTSRNC